MSIIFQWIAPLIAVGSFVLSLWNTFQIRSRDARQQAEQVTAWFVPMPEEQLDQYPETYVGLYVHNATNQIVYDVVAEVVIARSTAVGDDEERNLEYGAMIGNVPPGGFTGHINTGGGAMHRRHLIELAFQDAAGRYWLRRGNGKLERIRKHPLDLFNIPRPVSWQKSA
jgi:hypothetical protein